MEDKWLDIARSFVRDEGGVMITLINETTLRLVREVVSAGLEEGWSIQRIARELRVRWPDLAKMRAERISRTETIRASNKGAMEGARSSGLSLRKEWIAADDARTRDAHNLIDNTAVAMDEPFRLLDPDTGQVHLAQFPGDPDLPASQTVNCRCTVAFIPV